MAKELLFTYPEERELPYEDILLPIPLEEEYWMNYIIAPEIALDWLKRNVHNRVKNKRMISVYAKDLTNKNWMVTGETIKFDRMGRLLDGQNRLHAIIKSQVPMTCDVRFGLNPQSFVPMDSGVGRRKSTVFGLMGEKYCNQLAGALNIVKTYEEFWSQQKNYVSAGNLHMSHSQAVAYLESNSKIRLSLEIGMKCGRIMKSSEATALHYLCGLKDRQEADKFFHQLITGENLSSGNPIYTLRERLLGERNQGIKSKMRTLEIAVLCIKAWNAARKGEKIFMLRWSNSGKKPEKFPIIE